MALIALDLDLKLFGGWYDILMIERLGYFLIWKKGLMYDLIACILGTVFIEVAKIKGG